MAVVARAVDSGSGINVLVDPGATGDMQVFKLAYGTTTNETLIGADANGLDVDVTRVDPGTGATNLGKAEDAAHTSGDVGVMALGVRKDTRAADAADGDYVALHVDNLGQLQVSGTQYEDAAHTSGDAGVMALVVRQDTAGTGIGANGDYAALNVDSNGRLRTIDAINEVRPSNSTTTALDNDGPVVKASAGTLYGFQGYSDANGFVQVHDKSSAPTSNNVPVIVIPVAANSPFSLDLSLRGRSFSNGIAFGFSSTGPTYTDGGSHLWVDAQYV